VAPRMFEQSGSGFKPATPSESQAAFDALNAPLPLAFTQYELGDVLDTLPSDATKAKLIALRQRALDLRAMWLPLSDELRDVRLDKQKSEARLRQLKLRRGEGGPDLADDDWQVVDVRKKLARFDSEIARLTALEQARGPAMRSAGMVLRAVEDWLRRPGGTLIEAPLNEISDVLKKSERIADGVERLRHRLRELDADAHRVNSAPYPSADAKKRLKDQIESAAMRAVPDVTALVEHNGDLGWPMRETVLPLVAINKDAGRARGQRSR
jgi:hypothetical protein